MMLLGLVFSASVVGCGGQAHSATGTDATTQDVALTDTSTCAEWTEAPRVQQNLYARTVAGRMDIPARFAVDPGDASSYAFGFIGGNCARTSDPINTTIGELTNADPGESEEAVDQTPSAPEPGGPLTYVGTINGHPEKATTLTEHYRLGPLLYSIEDTPPEEVLDACDPNAPAPIARSVFARGQVTITYSEGTLPIEFVEGSTYYRVVTNEVGEGLVALRVGSEWQCRTSFSLEFQPGETQTFPFWVIVEGALNNAQPRVPAIALDTWYFGFIGPSPYGAKLTTNGPGAGWCEEGGAREARLFLFNRSDKAVRGC